jgi:hypothetical protein
MHEEELQALSLKTTGDFIGSFMTRTSGKARGKERLGSYTDLGIFTRHEYIRVVVICTDLILRNSSKNDDLKSVYEAVFPDESVKNRVVCAILSSGHFDIGVVLENGCTRAVFDLGSDWDCALELILTFIKSKSPESLSVEQRSHTTSCFFPFPHLIYLLTITLKLFHSPFNLHKSPLYLDLKNRLFLGILCGWAPPYNSHFC